MKKQRFLLFLFATALLCSSFFPGGSPPETGSYLGFNLMLGPNSGLVTFGIVTPLPNGKKDVLCIARNTFIRMAAGVCKSEANTTGENLFAKYQVDECGVYRDSIFKKTSFACNTIDQIWKLRYQVGPYMNGPDTLGWTKSSVPSFGQMNILKSYGVSSLDEYFYGENAFRLLKDMQSYAWQSRYKGA